MAASLEDLTATRQSLLVRCKNWEDQQAWQTFFDRYWKLIYSVAIKAGLNETEARDVLQDTMLIVSRKLKDFNYDPAEGRFRNWLCHVTRHNVSRQWRRRQREEARALRFEPLPSPASSVRTDQCSALGVPPNLEAIWQGEWQASIMDIALERVKTQVNPKQYQIFDFYVLKHWPMQRVTEALRVNMAQVYLAKSRVSKRVAREFRSLADGAEKRRPAGG